MERKGGWVVGEMFMPISIFWSCSFFFYRKERKENFAQRTLRVLMLAPLCPLCAIPFALFAVIKYSTSDSTFSFEAKKKHPQ
jgi:hypothetical protein